MLYCPHGFTIYDGCSECSKSGVGDKIRFTNKEHKMTREEARKKIVELYPDEPDRYINILEALGLLKFEKEEINKLFEITPTNVYWPAAALYQPDTKALKEFNNKYGVVRLEEWPEGLVLWVGGEIKWKSWGKYYKKGDACTIEFYYGNIADKINQAGIIKE